MYTRLAGYWLLLVLLVGTVGGAWAQTAPPLNLNLPPQQTPTVPDSSRARTPADSGRVAVPRPAPSRPLPVRRPRTLILQTEAADQPLLRRYRVKTSLPDSLAVLREVRELVLALQGESYLTASADDMRWHHDTVRVQLYVGEKFLWARLRNGNLGDGLLTRAGYREKLYRGQPFQPQEWSRLQERILQEAENQGFPFATVRLDSAQLRGADIEGRVLLERGPLIVFDSLQIVGSTKVRKRFLTKYLQLFPEQPFSQQRVEEAARRLRQLPYLQLKAEPEVRFAKGRARVYLLLEDRTANQFDAIVGILPNPTPGIGQKRVQVTGDVTIALRNIKGGGKGLGLQWRKVDLNSQQLDAQYTHPTFFGTPLELGGSFNLYRQSDPVNAFQTLRPRIQLTYPTARAGRISFFTEWRSSRLLATDSLATTLPANIDTRFTSYGLDYTWTTLDDAYFPRSGILANGQTSVGSKIISRNSQLKAELYQGLPLRTTQVSASTRLERYTRIGRGGVLLTRLRGEALFNRRLFLNDLFRVGGLATLRGFNELNFYASQYAVGTAEFRQFTGPDAYVFAFVDQGYLRQDILTQVGENSPTGVGAGLSFRTGAGQFQFVYALGRDNQQKLALNSGKIHFGITSRF
ncbi:BamA/TamA family outer membrane protein [Hymenobacter sp. BT186]|uniref:BamA/TamA family outer membrane protein n=1 Tax=Hymenobacter telluris TaxID=2816474 RepID=A0A939EYD9_9BACT|nr:BamA/TamA family outer membrane protein [Hymenobacter telluris]MBO0359461.1 BamA/TamA family outer membrane protein [Hymenobacter telluris]MBW3375487.1 BamA/TamA family outer membrane protein [Hymenobacter norwichensis]